jgi:hypothetical protein
MKSFGLKTCRIAPLVVFCFIAGVGTQMAQAQTPTSGAMLTIKNSGGTILVQIYDSQIHSGTVQAVLPSGGSPACGEGIQIPTDAYVLQGGSATGCDPTDGYEVTDLATSATTFTPRTDANTHQHSGSVDIAGFHIETHYICAGACAPPTPHPPYTAGFCNTSRTICTAPFGPDSGFLIVTNNTGSDFTGTITLQGITLIAGDPFCPVNKVASDSVTFTPSDPPLAAGGSVTLALGSQGGDGPKTADSSNCGGVNAPQTQTLTAGTTSTFTFGNDLYKITPFNSNPGDMLTFLPVPVPAGPLGLDSWALNAFGLQPLENPVFTSPLRFSATSYSTQASIPFSDFSALTNPVSPEIQLNCTPAPETSTEEMPQGDCPTFLYTAELDLVIDTNSLPKGVGGVRFLGDAADQCPTTGFNFDSLLSYKGGTTATDPPIHIGGNPMGCFVATFDPTVAPVPTGVTVSIFGGLESPVVPLVPDPPGKPTLNRIDPGKVEPLKWSQSNSDGTPNTKLSWCPHGPGANPADCSDAGVGAPWVFLSRIPLVCPNGAVSNIVAPLEPNSSGFKNDGGKIHFNWQTSKNDTGCTTVVLQFDSGLFVPAANFQFTP